MILQQIQEYFEKKNWSYSLNKDEMDNSYLAAMDFKIGNTVFNIFCEIYPDSHCIKLFLYSPISPPKEKIYEVLYLLNYINSSRVNCIFVILNDNQIRLQDFVKFTSKGVNDKALDYLFYSSFDLLEVFYPYILNIIVGDTTASDQIAMISGEYSHRLN
ncbi:MAG: YbjN domain-containing protein [Chromatiaceae bacterium]|nr:YbjN domain-containing protein [Chromatiaceae bacterium]